MVGVVHAQRKYVFTHIIEYHFQSIEKGQSYRQFILTNPEDDSYILYASETGKGDLNCNFKDKKGVSSRFSLRTTDLIKAETITLDCNLVYEYNSSGYVDPERYVYEIDRDTVIDRQSYKMHTFAFRKNRDFKKYKAGTAYYIVENGTDFLPLIKLYMHPYENFFEGIEMPGGIAKEAFTISKKKGKKDNIYKLISIQKISKFVILPTACDYTIKK